MKKYLFTVLIFVPILFYGQVQIGQMGIKQIATTSWSCSNADYNLPPFAASYGGGICGFDIELLLWIPYWYHCIFSNYQSFYWFRTFENTVGGNNFVRCYDAEYEGDILTACNGIVNFPFGPIPGRGVYFQIDLYSQCTNCTGPMWTGSWWTSHNIFNQGFLNANSVDEYISIINSDPCDVVCLDLHFNGSPPCTCESNYGCGVDDQS